MHLINYSNVEGDEKIFTKQKVHEIWNEIVYQPNVVANTYLYRLLFFFPDSYCAIENTTE